MRNLLPYLSLLLLLVQPSLADKPWFYPRAASKSYVNPYLTPRRALKGPWSHRFQGQLVLWQGVAGSVKRSEPQSLQLHTSDGPVPVKFSRKVKNLQADRDGHTVAIKGYVKRTQDGRIYLEGRSVIPWRPKDGYTADRPLIEQWIDFQRPELPQSTRNAIVSAITKEASREGVDPLFLTALIQVESGFDPQAVSVSGAQGLGQLMPTTAQGLGVDPSDLEQNVRGCARMVGNLLRRYQHRWDGKALVLASYNAGPNLVARIQSVPHYEQTVNYVYFIGSLHNELTRQQRRLQESPRTH